MTENTTQNNSFNAISLILFFWSKRKVLITVSIIAIVASVIFSHPYFIPPKYESTVVLFPSSTNSISKALLGDNQGYKQDLLQFGEEENAEQLIQILNSSKIRDRIITKYHLMRHYDIDESGQYKRTLLHKEYSSNISYRRTENMAVEITVLDTDPDTASFIANDISSLLDSVKIQMQKNRAYRGYEIVKREYENLQRDIQTKEDSMTRLREKGIHDYETQAEMLNRQLAIEIAKNANSNAVKALENKMDILAKYGGPYVSLRDALEHDKKLLSEVREKYDNAKIDAYEELPQTFVVDRAYPAEKKTYPIRWVIVAVSLLSTLLLTAFLLIVIDGISKETAKK
ncbi:MAG: hypothetical protein DRI86_02725 [Bacteroidetes bacterium]|nr:MAG: hypothetical protein DRI86_02725 [Bacteroidota bacterium]